MKCIAVVAFFASAQSMRLQEKTLTEQVKGLLDRVSKEDLVKAASGLDGTLSRKGGSSSSSSGATFYEPILPGVMPGASKPKIILAADIDWPPYAYLGTPPESDYDTAGIGHDIAKGLATVCDMDVTVVQTGWGDCWSDGAIGTGLKDGHYHGCMTYTHTAGARPRMMEFTNAFLSDNKPAGLLTRLVNGVPVVSPTSDLSGVNVVDVNGWAPTADTLAIVRNPCTGNYFSGYNMIMPTDVGNDAAMAMLMDGTADAMWVYADQAYTYDCSAPGVTPSWNCTLWSGLGTKFAYIQTGLYGHALNGTTLAISKKGSGLASVLNPCLEKLMQTQTYYDICQKHGLTSSCYPNSYFPSENFATNPWETSTDTATSACSSGYCSCAR